MGAACIVFLSNGGQERSNGYGTNNFTGCGCVDFSTGYQGFIVMSVYMVGEKPSDVILADAQA